MPGNLYSINEYDLIPIRYEDRLNIMKWRNEQIYHLRQKELLTQEQQDQYFKEIVAKLFDQEYPEQILFSYLENGICIGYGGLVHIDWYNKNAEISFIIDPNLATEYFNLHWKNYLSLLYKYAFEELNLHKIYTYAFDIRPYLYPALEEGGLLFETRLKEHIIFERNYKDVVTHYKLNPVKIDFKNLHLRLANLNDAEIIFNWANESTVREQSFNSQLISWNDHISWYNNKLESEESDIYILHDSDIERPLGQIRLDYSSEEQAWYIGYSIDKLYRGLGLGIEILKLIKKEVPLRTLHAQIKKGNTASIKTFEKADYKKSFNMDDDILIYEYKRING